MQNSLPMHVKLGVEIGHNSVFIFTNMNFGIWANNSIVIVWIIKYCMFSFQ